MKKLDSKRITGFLILIVLLICGNLYSQSSSFGNTYIFNNGEMGIVDIQHNFFNGGSGILPGTVGTERTLNQGFMSFVGTASWVGASDAAHVDGYVKTYKSTSFTFPVGDNGKYRPAAVSTATLANPANAAYYGVSASTAITSRLKGGNEPVLPASGPFNTTQRGPDVTNVSNVEYWDINGTTPAKITLTWDANSAIGSLNHVGILGWNGTEWRAISSAVDATSLLGGSSSLASGSITTNEAIVPDAYEIYTLGTVCGLSSAPIVSSTIALINICTATTANLNNSVTSSTPTGYTLVWFTNTSHNGTAYPTPATAGTGTYYPFYFDSVNNCYTPPGSGVTIFFNAPPDTPTVASLIQPNCSGATSGTIVFTTQPGVEYSIDNGFSYQLSPTFTGLAGGEYLLRVRLIDRNVCAADAVSAITIYGTAPSAPTFSSTTATNVCPATTININNLVTSTTRPGISLVWFTNSRHFGSAYATPATATSGTYFAFYFDSVHNCYSPVSTKLTVDLDSDCDLIVDSIDIDDDNDGVLDVVEQNCTLDRTGLTISVTPGFEGPTAGMVESGNGLLDGLTDQSTICWGSVNYTDRTILTFSFANPTSLKRMELSVSPATSTILAPGNVLELQGFDGTNWISLARYTQSTIKPSLIVSYPNVIGFYPTEIQPYSQYRVFGVTALLGPGGIFMSEALFQAECTDIDTDGDGKPNRTDLDSDQDGCSDAKESGATTSNATNYVFTGAVGANGLANVVETSTDSGSVNYTLTYANAINNAIRSCVISCPTVTNSAANNVNPSTCASTDGSIQLCGLAVGESGYVINYTKNGSAATPLTNQTADVNGCVRISNLGAGLYNSIVITHPIYCTTGTAALGPITLAGASTPSVPTVASTIQPTCGVPSGTIVFTAQSGVQYSIDNGATYQTSPTFSGLMTGSYYLKVRSSVDTTCIASVVSPVTINSAPIKTTPNLTVSGAVCNGTTYEVSFNSNGNVTSSTGVVSGNKVTGIAVGTNVVLTSTATNGCASTQTTVKSPASCETPIEGCTIPTISAGNGVCSGTGTYSVSVTVSSGALIEASSGVVSGNSITGIAIGTSVTITAKNGTCTSSVIVHSPSDCTTPCAGTAVSYSVGGCLGTTYTVSISNPKGASISASVGTVTPTSVTNIPVGTDVNVTATITGCNPEVVTLSSPKVTSPNLTVSGAVCNGTTYNVSFNSNGNVTASTGLISGNTVTGIALGNDVILTSTAVNSCASTQTTVLSPISCDTPIGGCIKPTISAGNGVCSGSGTYSVSVSVSAGAVIEASSGIVSGNSVTAIAVGTPVTITAKNDTCTTSVKVSSPLDCSSPCAGTAVSYSIGSCTGITYSVSISNPNGASILASAGTVSSTAITNIAIGTNVTITATATGCTPQVVTLSSPSSCIINAVDDTLTAVSGITSSVINNDMLRSSTPVIGTGAGQVTLISTPTTELSINSSTGVVTVTANTKAGTYSIPYTICEVNNTSNCDTATATVTVNAPIIDAVDDTYTSIDSISPTIITNDRLNGVLPVIGLSPGNVKIFSTPTSNLSIDLSTGIVTVTPNTPVGTYTISYTICEVTNPTNCDSATATISVPAPDFSPTIDIDQVVFSAAGASKDFVVNISELGYGSSIGQVVFVIPKLSAFAISYNPTATSANVSGNTTVRNKDWTITENSMFIKATLKSNVVINQGNFSNFGFTITRKPNIPTQTWQSITATIQNVLGSDHINTNNTYNVLLKAQ